MDTGEQTEYPDIPLRSSYSIKTSTYYICDGYCYYTNMLDRDLIYSYCFETGENQMILSESGITEFWVLGENFYYRQDHHLYCMSLKTMEKKMILENADGEIQKSVDGSKIYISSENSEGIYWIDLNSCAGSGADNPCRENLPCRG